MTVVRNRFMDPVTGDTYTWHRNHSWDGEERSGGDVPVTWATTTAGAPLPQYGESQPVVWTLRGTILHRAQHGAFLEWVELSASQTIYFRDYDNVEYEVVITAYRPKREGVSKNPADSTMRLNTYTYELVMTIIRLVP